MRYAEKKLHKLTERRIDYDRMIERMTPQQRLAYKRPGSRTK